MDGIEAPPADSLSIEGKLFAGIVAELSRGVTNPSR